MNDDDNNTADHNRCRGGFGNNDNAISAVYHLSGGKRTTGGDQLSGKGTAVCSDRIAGGVLSERCTRKYSLWLTGADRHIVYRGAA